MKKTFKFFLYTFFLFAFVIGVTIFLVYKIQKENLYKNQKESFLIWNEIIKESNKKDSLLLKINNNCELDSLSFFLNQKSSIKESCNINFSVIEYKINKLYLYAKDSCGEYHKENLSKLHNLNTKINSLKNSYNDKINNLNMNISSFPGFFIAKHLGVQKKFYLDVEFGENGKNPMDKLKELENAFSELEKSYNLKK